MPYRQVTDGLLEFSWSVSITRISHMYVVLIYTCLLKEDQYFYICFRVDWGLLVSTWLYFNFRYSMFRRSIDFEQNISDFDPE